MLNLGVLVLTGCRKTYRKINNLPEVNCPIYLKTTIDSISKSDIPTDTITICVDSLNWAGLSSDFDNYVNTLPYLTTYNCGGGVTKNLLDSLIFIKKYNYTHLLILEDDVIVDKKIYSKTVQFIHDTWLTMGSLYNVFDKEDIHYNDFWGGQAIVLSLHCLDVFIEGLSDYKKLCPNEPDGWPDIRLSRIAGAYLKEKIHIYPHSLVQHIGKVSSWGGGKFHTTNRFN